MCWSSRITNIIPTHVMDERHERTTCLDGEALIPFPTVNTAADINLAFSLLMFTLLFFPSTYSFAVLDFFKALKRFKIHYIFQEVFPFSVSRAFDSDEKGRDSQARYLPI